MPSEQLIVGNKYKSQLKESLGENVIWIPDNPFVDERLSGHVDLSVLALNKKIFALNYLKSYDLLSNCEYLAENVDKKYPNDAKMNACIVGKRVFCNKSVISKNILQEMIEGEYDIINVKQGYCRCCILPISSNAIISSDKGIINIARKNDFDVLEIKPGYIRLDGFDYGFIGGTGYIDDSIVYFTGSLKDHPSYDDIIAYCRNYNLNIEFLTTKPIFDIGGIIKTG